MERDPKTFAIIGAAMEVHSVLGRGFLEPVYQEALAAELALRGIPFAREVELPIFYKGRRLNTHYKADFVCYGCVIVELKALDQITGVEQSQIINYLKATGFEVGLLINFGEATMRPQRFANTRRGAQAPDRDRSADCAD